MDFKVRLSWCVILTILETCLFFVVMLVVIESMNDDLDNVSDKTKMIGYLIFGLINAALLIAFVNIYLM